MPSMTRCQSPLRRLALVLALAFCVAGLPTGLRADDATPATGKKKKSAPLPAFQPAEASGGSLRIVRGVPVLHLKGTPEQMGAQAGALLKEHIRYLLEQYFPKFIPGGKDRRKEALATARRFEKDIPDRFIAEMKACATAAGVEYEDLLLANVSPEIFEIGGCSAVAVEPALTKSGQILFGRNLDWNGYGVLQRFAMVTAYEPEGRKAFVSVGFPGLLGCVTALNAAGLSAGNLVVLEMPPPEVSGTPWLFMMRRLAEEASTAQEAVAIVQGAGRTVAHNIFVVDTKTARLMECRRDAVTVREPKDGVLVATNYFQEDVQPSENDARYSRLCKCLGEKPTAVEVPGIIASLKAALLPFMNLHSVVIEPATKTLHVAQGKIPASSEPYRELRWEWCFGAEPPVEKAAQVPAPDGGPAKTETSPPGR